MWMAGVGGEVHLHTATYPDNPSLGLSGALLLFIVGAISLDLLNEDLEFNLATWDAPRLSAPCS